MTAPSQQKIETGFVGFFDILGYGSLLSAGITETTTRVVDLLSRLPTHSKQTYSDFVGEGILRGDHDDFKLALKQIRYLVVSDSLLITAAYVDVSNPGMKREQAYAFLGSVCCFQRQMFEFGLPVRGAIGFGDFIVQDNVFAGRPIYDAYQLEQSLNLAACALHESAVQEWKALTGKHRIPELDAELKLSCVRYAAPTKKKGTTSTGNTDVLCLNLAWPTISTELNGLQDIYQYVHGKFIANDKQVGDQEMGKLNNTVAFLEFLKKEYPLLFNRPPKPQIR
jgi:hypothetical protein